MNSATDLLSPRLSEVESAIQQLSRDVEILLQKGPEHFAPRTDSDFEQSRRSWQKIEGEIQRIGPRFASWFALWEERLARERTVRLEEIENPPSAENLAANLRWLIARGTKDNLPLLAKLKEEPRYPTTEVLQLIDMAIQQLNGQTNEEKTPYRIAMEKGEEAYWAHQEEWDRQYAGRYIAVYQGEVIASDDNKKKLLEAIFKKQHEEGPFYACILRIGTPMLEVKGPR